MVALINLLFSISSMALLVLSVPLKLRDVVSPPITSPTTGTVWHVGETQLVTWSTVGLSPNVTNPVGMLVLGYMYNNSENLMLDSPLATNINYTLGQVQITVPNVDTRDDYIIILFGDSGNASPEFTIINDSSSSTFVPPTSTSGTTSVISTSTSGISSFPSISTSGISSFPSTFTSDTTSTPSGTAGTTTATLVSVNNQASASTTTASATQSILTSAAWRNHASGVSIMIALLSLVYIL